MNRYPEAINAFLAWLLQDPNQTVSAPSGKHSSRLAGPDEFGSSDLQWYDLDSLNLDEVEVIPHDLDRLSHFPFQEGTFLELGDTPAVQERFYALLKRRLRAEIERNPPLFPWESEVYDYSSERPDWATPEIVPGKLWTIQLQNLNLPVPMPEALLLNLFEQCQSVVESSLREGAKLVRAVEALFPGQDAALNQLAGYVMASPSRSGASATQSRLGTADFPGHYESATTAQQMALSLIAAKEILNSLTLTVSPNQPKAERCWQTEAGLLTLEIEYQPQSVRRLRVQGQLPCEGSIRFQNQEAQSAAQRATPGYVSVELFNPDPYRIYSLEVQLRDVDHPPIIFAIQSEFEPD
ncbi:hypothetical protein IQ268_29435 [Oculatella sp. LEGE 06141]|uniref:hypothetical protein n=1 Tax=Oculatella sp. LEGE 06141 TaxID=1828648 RepID=UPI0018813957|nr:hypothetical protein [Oculatella sp. LEGE 06141]MBE9182665.1 hypothetical protein [Oculatella sp. LEGE 06141]